MKKEILAGVGLGFLIGTIIGLSIAEVTGIILGALTSVLAAFFGLKPAKEGEKPYHAAIASFGFACLAAIFLGIFIRTHNLLAPSLEAQIEEYVEAGFSEEEARQYVLVQHLGIIPQGMTFSADSRSGSGSSVLMAGDEELILCTAIDTQSSLVDIKQAFSDSGGKYDELQRKLSDVISDPVSLKETLILLKTMICP